MYEINELKMAHAGRERRPLSTSMQPGGWIECAGMWGDRIPWWGGADDKATQQSPSKFLSGKTWKSKHQSPSLLDLASTFTGTGGREERTFAKEPSYAGCGDAELCVSYQRASPAKQPGWRQMRGWERDSTSWHWLSTLCSSWEEWAQRI